MVDFFLFSKILTILIFLVGKCSVRSFLCTCSIMQISPAVNSIYQLSFLVAPIHLSQSDFATPIKQSSRCCQRLHLFLSGLFSAVTSVPCTSTLLCSSELLRNPAQLESIQLKELSSVTKVTLKNIKHTDLNVFPPQTIQSPHY